MASDLKNQITGTVVGGLILSVILWLTDSFPKIWEWCRSAGRWVWELLIAAIPVPAGILIVAACLAAAFLFRFRNLKKALEQSRDSSEVMIHQDETATAERDPDLDGLEIKLLRIFAKADGRLLSTEFLPQHMGLNRLRTEKVLQGLYGHNLIDARQNYIHGTRFYLTPRGRDFVIKHGLDVNSKQA